MWTLMWNNVNMYYLIIPEGRKSPFGHASACYVRLLSGTVNNAIDCPWVRVRVTKNLSLLFLWSVRKRKIYLRLCF